MPSERTIEDLFHNLPSPSSDFEQRAKLMTALDDTAKLKLAVEALEHYANNAHWDEYEDEFNGESGWYSIFNKTVDFGNKVAEAALKQIGEPAKGRDI